MLRFPLHQYLLHVDSLHIHIHNASSFFSDFYSQARQPSHSHSPTSMPTSAPQQIPHTNANANILPTKLNIHGNPYPVVAILSVPVPIPVPVPIAGGTSGYTYLVTTPPSDCMPYPCSFPSPTSMPTPTFNFADTGGRGVRHTDTVFLMECFRFPVSISPNASTCTPPHPTSKPVTPPILTPTQMQLQTTSTSPRVSA
ncbi:hypothetical protein D9758_017609 [Tetrapyrgos nigripes]|uniref:Uncharacterized protein n=1 Tax=Tetrapyrgos nigripes TaxID=182062 RepID=A0A8H5BBI3_9AGAR|nr:hypothetical protein D9758_017609 [Tetrapyrgos nigripes]